jgi:hypothetical protein
MSRFGDFVFGKKEADPTAVDPKQAKLARKIARSEFWSTIDKGISRAIENGWSDALAMTLRHASFGNSGTPGAVISQVLRARNMDFVTAIEGPVAHLKDGIQCNVIVSALRSDWDEGAETLLQCITDQDTRAAGINWAFRNGYSYRKLNEQAEARAVWMIEQGANVHYGSGTLLKHAIRFENFVLAGALLDAGFDLALYEKEIDDYLTKEGASFAARKYFTEKKAALAPALLPAPAPAAAADSASHIIEERLPDGGRLTVVFNFALQQQFVIVEKPGQTSSPAVVPFSAVPAQTIEAVTRAYLDQGGNPSVISEGAVALKKAPPPI